MITTANRKVQRDRIDDLNAHIDNHDGFRTFNTAFYCNYLHAAFKKPLNEQEGYSHVFNGVAVSVLKLGKSEYGQGHGSTAYAVLENETGKDRIIFTGETIKASLFNHRYFQFMNDNPEETIDAIFSKTDAAHLELSQQHSDIYQARRTIAELLQPIEDVNAFFDTKIAPIM